MLFFSLLVVLASSHALQLEQYNITIIFSENVVSGTFANGDYWVQGPVTLVSTAPAFNGSRNGFEINPNSILQQGFDARIAGYNASHVPLLPCSLQPGDRLVKAMSIISNKIEHDVALKTAIVVTVVDKPPPATAMRPPYFGNVVTRGPSSGGYWTTDMIDLRR
jgi:hypothetical protein